MYNFKAVEKKWQKRWDDEETFKAVTGENKPKWYGLIEFPYPSAQGLHVGHPRSYTAMDVIARKRRMQGYNVLFPIGFDAFGLPAENFAIKNHVHPKIITQQNIDNFTRQLKSIGFSFDWSRCINTTDPEYYKWTQWIFIQLFKKGLAYKTTMTINYCTSCKVGLSNEEVVNGKCERCGGEVIQKEKSEWMLKITEYAQRLIDDLDEVDFLDRIKAQQINWIGRSEGAEVEFKIAGAEDSLRVYTTRPDTLFGATYMVIAPEHKLVEKYKDRITNFKEVEKYQKEAAKKSDFERTEINKTKSGVELKGLKAINPVNNEEIPIWISDYVLASYGTGAIMAVPAHDERDYEFATKFNIPIIQVLEEITGTPHENESKKNSIVAIVYDEKNDKYLSINWHDKGGRLFIGGSIKDGETPLDCAKREVEEETGYYDLEFVKELPKINHHYYAYNKDKYFNIECTGILFKLKSDKKKEQNLDDDEAFDVEWVDKDTINNEIMDELHKRTFEYATNPGAMIGDGTHINSEFLNGLNKEEAIEKIIAWLEKEKIGEKKVNYKLRDWVFSRQRYWGEPIPMVYCEKCGWQPIDEKELPLTLPDVKEFEPGEEGESPLASHPEWYETTCPKCKGKAVRETDTMPQWAGSSWYYLRYMDPENNKALASKKALKYWNQVDWYNGGMEHTTLHLLYSRFWHKFLYDIGVVPTKEPYGKRTSHGMILGPNGEKMSKSKGNVINPDDMVNEYGADTLRVYEMFMGPFDQTAPWSIESIRGCSKFLDRIWKMQDIMVDGDEYSPEHEKMMHKAIKKVTNDIEEMKFNTCVSTFMEMVNEFVKDKKITKKEYRDFLILLNPFAPHLSEEINEVAELGEPIAYTTWPKYDEKLTIDDMINLPIQINGKLRATIDVAKDLNQEELKQIVHDNEKIQKLIEDKTIVKEIYVPNRIYNIVIK